MVWYYVQYIVVYINYIALLYISAHNLLNRDNKIYHIYLASMKIHWEKNARDCSYLLTYSTGF